MQDPVPSLADLGIDPDVATRLLPYLDSFVKWELLRFLHDNPNMAATVEELARYLGRDEMELKPAARALAGVGIFHQSDAVVGYAYSLTLDEGMRNLIRHLVQSYQADRLVRLAISSHILKTRRGSASTHFAA